MNHSTINAICNDQVINAIQNKELNTSNLNFKKLRDLAGIDSNKHNELDRGRAIIGCQTLLNQYLYSYGLMVQRQWIHVIPHIIEMLNDQNHEMIHLYDYGCGQGLATLLLLENTIGFQENITKATLLDASDIALARAENIISCKLPNINIQTIEKKLDEVDESDLDIDIENINVHIFSNILDIESFDQFKLFHKILAKGGTHYCIAVSNDRNVSGGTTRLKSLYKTLMSIENEHVMISHAKFKYFSDENNMNHVFFCLKIEINQDE